MPERGPAQEGRTEPAARPRAPDAPPLFVHFAAEASRAWRIDRVGAVVGDGLPAAERLAVLEGPDARAPTAAGWSLRDATSNTRHANRPEADASAAGQQGLSRPQATRAALIPTRKTEAW